MSTNHVVFRDSFPPILENIYQYSRTIDIKVNSMNMKDTCKDLQSWANTQESFKKQI